jgi:hypothetical protein
MMVDMGHMGNGGKLAVITGIAAAGLLVLTGMTLAMPVFNAFIGVLALAYLSAVAELLARGRRAALLATGAGTSLTVGFALAFVGTWELAYDGQASFLGTPLPTDDPDNYFVGAGVSAAATLLVLFLGATLPGGRTSAPAGRRKPPPRRRPGPPPRTPRAAGAKGAPARNAASRGSASAGSSSRGSAQRAPARAAAGGKRPSSSAAPVRKPAPARNPSPRSGTGTAPRR